MVYSLYITDNKQYTQKNVIKDNRLEGINIMGLDSVEHRKRILAYKAQKVVCDCGCVISRSSKYIHLRSPKHKSLMNTIKDT